MLTELYIENFAIIDKLQLRFKTGLITFTGETGAGKSIIMDALNTLLGSRADSTFIRSGSETALVEATFRIPPTSMEAIHAVLEREAMLDDPNFVTLGREIRRDRGNVVRINGRMSNVSILREIGQHLVDIHGQSEHLSLLRVSQHLRLLDRYADLHKTFDEYRSSYQHLLKLRQELEELRTNERQAAQRADLLTYQINEIDAASLKPGEESELEEERNRLANAEKLSSLGQKALVILDESSPEEPSITDRLGEVAKAITNLSQLDESQNLLQEQATTTFEELSEISHTLRVYLENLEFNPKRLDQVEERLDLISTLKRKYGDSIQDVIAFGVRAKQDLDAITHASERIEFLETEEGTLLTELGKRAQALANKRHVAADKMQKAIEIELGDLRMSGARFQVNFLQEPDPEGIILPDGERVAFNADGHEQVEFFIETNPGEGFKPLVRIASGGETSRLMLALKNVLVQADHIPTLVFDEIDQGIGGRVGTVVGQKLWLLAQRHQVFCITHLPQLAAFGHQHYRVQKSILDGRTTTQAMPIDGQDRLHELAQMLGEVSESTIHSAREILQIAKQRTST
ncbi:MAG: DNA repair protein RecN [Anaerolineales bacterium]|nr:DNA repair protein RecN [Chloroflexota bacterium]MBL6981195.1 DNA repair protein RecN [Anaerolineales bacterium]